MLASEPALELYPVVLGGQDSYGCFSPPQEILALRWSPECINASAGLIQSGLALARRLAAISPDP